MRVFVDANILVSVLNKEFPLFTYSARILSLADNKRFTLFTSPVCLAIAFYFAEKKCGTPLAKQKIAFLTSKLQIANIGKREIERALADKKVNDFEDGIQYYAALENKCTAIITQDTEDYYYSTVAVLNAEDFLTAHVLT
jgi:predicted nucleic acid-binding protein